MGVKERVRKLLGEKHPDEDVCLWVFGIPWGFWIWDEKGLVHDQFRTADLDQEIREALPRIELTKEDVFGPESRT